MSQHAASLSSELVERVGAFRLDDVPAAAIARARLALLDSLGEALASTPLAHPPLARLAAYVGLSTGGSATLIGQRRMAPPVEAALFNAALATFGLTDSLHGPTTLHAPVITGAAALAAAEQAGSSGAAFFGAFVLGTEIACRTSAALNPDALYRRGFHPTGVCGSFGAAIAAAHALGLPREQLRAALGLAFQQACGCLAWTTDATESARPLSPGFAARNGVTAALLAAQGMGGPPEPFDGRYSAFAAFSDDPRPAALLAGWGEDFAIAGLTHKLHASCTYTHAAIDALLALVGAHGLVAANVEEIIVRTVPSALAMITEPGLRSCHAPYVLAVSLVSGRIVIDDIVNDRTAEPAVRDVQARVQVVGDPALADGAARIELRLRDGRQLERQVDHAKGTPRNPVNEADIRAKFAGAAQRADFGHAADAIIELVDRIERLDRLDPLCTLLRGDA